VWRGLIEGLHDDVEFAVPASDNKIDQVEQRLGLLTKLPDRQRQRLMVLPRRALDVPARAPLRG
jgi:hypothetical protein